MTRVQELYPDSKIILREVGLRDGLQLVKTFPSTEAKQRWIRDEYAAGVRHFEVGSFLPAKTFPQFADVRDIIGTVASLPGAYGIALTLNERGVNEALASGVAEVATVVSATEEHSQANANRSRESAIANVKRLCELRDASAHKPVVNSAISMALGCSIVGAVDPKEVLLLTEKLFEAGVDMVAIADTVGYAGPKQVGELTAAAVKIAGSKPICIHLHDTRGMGIANASAALDAGARVLDGSLGGLGGCPFAPGATGNVVFDASACASCLQFGASKGCGLRCDRWSPSRPCRGPSCASFASSPSSASRTCCSMHVAIMAWLMRRAAMAACGGWPGPAPDLPGPIFRCSRSGNGRVRPGPAPTREPQVPRRESRAIVKRVMAISRC